MALKEKRYVLQRGNKYFSTAGFRVGPTYGRWTYTKNLAMLFTKESAASALAWLKKNKDGECIEVVLEK